MMVSATTLTVLIWASLVCVAAGAVYLLMILIREWKNEQLW